MLQTLTAVRCDRCGIARAKVVTQHTTGRLYWCGSDFRRFVLTSRALYTILADARENGPDSATHPLLVVEAD